jgi:hypothetical protein
MPGTRPGMTAAQAFLGKSESENGGSEFDFSGRELFLLCST